MGETEPIIVNLYRVNMGGSHERDRPQFLVDLCKNKSVTSRLESPVFNYFVY